MLDYGTRLAYQSVCLSPRLSEGSVFNLWFTDNIRRSPSSAIVHDLNSQHEQDLSSYLIKRH